MVFQLENVQLFWMPWLAQPHPQSSLPFVPGGMGLKVEKHITLIQRGYNPRSASCSCCLLWLAL